MGNLKIFRIMNYQYGLILLLGISIGLINGQETTMLPMSDMMITTQEPILDDSTMLPSSSFLPTLSLSSSSQAIETNATSTESSQMITTTAQSLLPTTEKTLSVIPLKDPTPTKDSINFEENETDSSSPQSPNSFGSFWDFTTAFQKNYLAKHSNSTNSTNGSEQQTTTSSSSALSSASEGSDSVASMTSTTTTTTATSTSTTEAAPDVRELSSSTSETLTTTSASPETSLPTKTDKINLTDSPIIFLATTMMPEQKMEQINSTTESVDHMMTPASNNEGNIILSSSSQNIIPNEETTSQPMMANEEMETTEIPVLAAMAGETQEKSETADKISATGENNSNNLSTEMLMERETTIMPDMNDMSSSSVSAGVITNEIRTNESHLSSPPESTSESTSSSSAAVAVSSSSEASITPTESTLLISSTSTENQSPVFVVGSESQSETVNSMTSGVATATTLAPEQQATLINSSMSDSSESPNTMMMTAMPPSSQSSETISPSVIVVSPEMKGRALNLTEMSSSTESMHNHDEHHLHHEHSDDDGSMMTMEDGEQHVFHGEGRSIDVADPLVEEDPYHPHLNFVTTEKSAHYSMDNNRDKMIKDLSDVSMDDDDVEIVNHLKHNNTNNGTAGEYSAIDDFFARHAIAPVSSNAAADSDCIESGRNYKNGETMNRDCDEKCTCNNGNWICLPRCNGVFFKRGRAFADPLCHEKLSQEDECCATMICTETARTINDNLNSSFMNESKSSSNYEPLLPTIPPTTNTTTTNTTETDQSTMVMSSTPAALGCMHEGVMYRPRERLEIDCEQICFCEADGNMNCRKRCPDRIHSPQEKCVLVRDPKDICCQLEFCDVTLDGHEQTEPPPLLTNGYMNNTDDENDITKQQINETRAEGNCEYKGDMYKPGEQFHDGCDALCICTPEGVHCAKLECPSTFGLDVLDPHCLKWEPEPSTFKPVAPKCCPERMRCIDNGSCEYEGQRFDNWAEIPSNLTGCEKHCYCEVGRIECRPACAPVPALPPSHLPCHPKDVRLLPIPDEECCKRWTCLTNDVPSRDYDDNRHKGHKDKLKSQSSSELDDNGKDSNSVGPFYPTIDGKPPKIPLEKPSKSKYNKDPGPSTSTTIQPIISNDVKYDQQFVPIIGPPSGGNSQHEHIIIEQQPHQHSHHHHQQQQQQQQQQQEQHKKQLQYPEQQYHSFNAIGGQRPSTTNNQYNLNNNNHQGVNFYDPSQSTKSHYGNVDFNRHFPYGPEIGNNNHGVGPGFKQPNAIIPNSGKPNQNELYNILAQNGGHINNGINRGLPPPPLPPSLVSQQQQQHHHRQQQQQQQVHIDNSNLPPHIRIEHILQHLQSNEPNQIQHQQHLHHNQQQQTNQQQGNLYQGNRAQGISGLGNSNDPTTQIIHIPLSAPDGTNHELPFNSFTIHHLGDDGLPGPPIGGSVQGQPIIPNNVIEHDNNHGIINQRPPLPPNLPTSQSGALFNPNLNDNLNSLSPNLKIIDLEAIDPHTVRIAFKVPSVYVNLHGRVELRYSNGASNDTSKWDHQIFVPPEDLIATSQLEFQLPNLEPNSMYKIQITLLLRDLSSQPTSEIYTVETPPERTITPPSIPTDYRPDFEDVFKNIEDPELKVSESNATWLRLSWKKLPENDLEYVDGIQLRYKELSGMIYDATPLVHRTLTSYIIENLEPNTAYEIGLYYIPFPGHGAELRAGNMITVRTSPKVDVYSFDVMVNVTKVKSTSVEVSWNGVPYPEDKYVNIYRAIYQSDAGKEDSSVFKVAKRDSTTGTLIMDLKPGTRYRLWLETYLTNGKIKKSNVVNFVTKPGGPGPVPGKTGKLLTAGDSQPVGDYYGPLVVVAVVAALAVMSTLILLMILTRRRTHHTASITPPRKSEAAYDNPSYKVEIQQETMNL